MLAAIEAQYGLSREQLLAGEGEAADLYRFIVANLSAAQADAEAGVTEGAIRRGILRSGIAAEQQADVVNEFAQRGQQASADRDAKMSQIALAIQELEAEMAREKTATAVDYTQRSAASASERARALALAG
jgi:hypothetical protein